MNQTKINKILVSAVIVFALYAVFMTIMFIDAESASKSRDDSLAQQIFQLQVDKSKTAPAR